MEEQDKKYYSFSRLSTFDDCQHAYFLQYVLKAEGKENIYGLLGGACHHALEELQQGKLTNLEALEYFNKEAFAADFIGIKFPNDNIKESYMKNVRHAIMNYKPVGTKFDIELKFDLEIGGVPVLGYIDFIIHNDDGTVSIIDYKTSSKFSKKDLPKKANQLLIYAIAMEQMGYKVRDISWMMLKYCTVPGKRGTKTIERRDLEDENYETFYVYYPYDEFTKLECITWLQKTSRAIEEKLENPFCEWEPKKISGSFSTFFCHNLCGVKGNCKTYKNICKEYYE